MFRFTRSDDRLYAPVNAHAKHAMGRLRCLAPDNLLLSILRILKGCPDALNTVRGVSGRLRRLRLRRETLRK